jgi:hypothetical protein
MMSSHQRSNKDKNITHSQQGKDTTGNNGNIGHGQQDVPINKKRGWEEIESLFDQKKIKEQPSESTSKKGNDVRRKGINHQQRSSRFKSMSNEKRDRSEMRNDTTVDGWVDDGLGGKYNSEGYTGRVSEDGMKIFKAHVLAKHHNAGQTKDCPFDCTCCYI